MTAQLEDRVGETPRQTSELVARQGLRGSDDGPPLPSPDSNKMTSFDVDRVGPAAAAR